MNDKIDVVGIMLVAGEVAASHGLHETHDALKEARAAIAELIDKVDSALTLGWSDTAARELRAALARVGGA